MKLPRAECPVCRADVAVRRGGELREHADHRHAMFGAPGRRADEVPKCPGSGYYLGDGWEKRVEWPAGGRP